MNELKNDLAWLLHDIWSENMIFIIDKYCKDIDISTTDLRKAVNKAKSLYNYLSDEDRKRYESQAVRIIDVLEHYLARQRMT